MTEQLPPPATTDDRARQLVTDLHSSYPGIIEEWERQRTDAIASGEDGSPDIQADSDIAWWLSSEVQLALEYRLRDETGRERAIADYCAKSVDELHVAMREHAMSNPEPVPEPEAEPLTPEQWYGHLERTLREGIDTDGYLGEYTLDDIL